VDAKPPQCCEPTRGRHLAIVLGLALALHHDRAPAALVNFMGVYWILNGIGRS
jgi:hypothetical protein